MQADHLALVHLDAAVDLGRGIRQRRSGGSIARLRQTCIRFQTLGPCLHLVQGLGIGRQPRDTVGGSLVRFNQLARKCGHHR